MPDDRVDRILARLGNGGAGRATTRLCAVCAEVTEMSGAAIMLLANDRRRGGRLGALNLYRDQPGPLSADQQGVTQDTNLAVALLLALEANRRDDSFETRGAIQSALSSNPELLGFLRGSAESYKSVSVSPSGLIAAGSLDGTVDVWTAHDRRLVGTLSVGDGPVVVAFAPNGGLLAVLADGDQQLSVWDARTLTMVGDPFTDEAAIANAGTFTFSPDGRQVTASLWTGEIVTWDVATGRETGNLTAAARDPFRAVAYSPDGRLLATGSTSGRVALYDAASGAPTEPMLEPGPRTAVISLEFDAQGSRLAANQASGPGTYMWDLTTGQRITSSVLDGIQAPDLAFSPDGSRFAAGPSTETLYLFDPAHRDVPAAAVHTHEGWCSVPPTARTVATSPPPTATEPSQSSTSPGSAS